MRLRLKLTLFMIILVVILLILMGIINTRKSYSIVEDTAEKSAIEMVQTQSNIIKEISLKQMQMPYYLSVDENVISFLMDQQSQEKAEKVTDMFDEYVFDKNNLEGIFLANAQGVAIATQSANAQMVGVDFSDRDYSISTLQEKKSIISETLFSKKSGEPMFVITLPVFSSTGEDVIGFIATVVYAESMSNYLKDMKYGGVETSEAFLIDGKGNYIYTSELDMIGQPVKIKEIGDLVEELKNENSDTVDFVNYKADGESMMAVYCTVENTDWLLVITVSLSELRAPITSMNISMVVIFAILASVATFIIFFATKLLTQPVIDDLMDKNRKLEEFNQELEESQEKLRDTSERLAASETELKAQNEKLIESKEILDRKNRLLEVTLKSSNDGIWYYEILDEDQDVIDNFSTQSWSDRKILSVEEWEELIHPDDKDNSKLKFREFIKGNSDEFEIVQRVYNNEDNSYHWIRSKGRAFFDDEGKRSVLAGVHTDINELKKKEEQLNYLAYFDSLTDIPNRIQLNQYLEKLILSAQDGRSALAVLFLDIDNFKRINDSMGHKFGDEILKKTAQRLIDKKGKFDIVSRFGGDEFVVILTDIQSKSDAHIISKKFMDAFLEPFYVGEAKVFLNISIGIAFYPFDGTSAEDLLTNADIAMYKAKKEGKNRVDFYDPILKNVVVARLELEKGLRQAINNSEFLLYFQPQFNIKDGSLRGFEALIRWNSPKDGIIGPGGFIEVAEDTGMIIQIGEWVMMKACETMVKWKKEFGFDGVMSVNISSLQIKHSDFVLGVQSILSQTGILPDNLELEITESILIESFDLTVEKLIELRMLGIRVSLDDFGTGYSSLSYLKNLPVDTLKIDKSFIDEIMLDSNSKEIIGSIIHLVQNLNMETIAEGVEIQEQYDFLSSVGCDCYQGYYMSKPIPENEIEEKYF